jgi:hypothetical protein
MSCGWDGRFLYFSTLMLWKKKTNVALADKIARINYVVIVRTRNTMRQQLFLKTV